MYRLPNLNQKCTKCPLGNGKAVFGQSECKSEDVALIVVSAYPGNNEIQANQSLAPQTAESKKAGKPMGAGEFLRISLEAYFDKDPNVPVELKPFNKRVFFTNAIKCSPQRGRDKINVTQTMINKCRQEWLLSELNMFNPEVPILLAAGEAVKSLLKGETSVTSNRRKLHQIGRHPAIVTFNPIEVERGLIKTISNSEEVIEDLEKLLQRVKNPGKKISQLVKSQHWRTEEGLPPFGSMLWHFRKDMLDIKAQVLNYWSNHND